MSERAKSLEPVTVTRNGRRYFSREYKCRVVEECLKPGASVSGVALAYGFNANLVRRWIRLHEARMASRGVQLMPVTVSNESPPPVNPALIAGAKEAAAPSVIDIEYAGARIVVNGAVKASVLREVLDALARHR